VEREIRTQHLFAGSAAIPAVEKEQQSTPSFARPAWHRNEPCAAFRAGIVSPAVGKVHVLAVFADKAHNKVPIEDLPARARPGEDQIYSGKLERCVSRLTPLRILSGDALGHFGVILKEPIAETRTARSITTCAALDPGQ
jgi:hypothetical protein